MGLVNDQVRMGDAISIYNKDCFPRIYRDGLGQVPGISTPTLQVSPLQIGAFAIGSGLIVGGIFVPGPGGTLMSVVGGVTAGFSILTILMGMLSASMSAQQHSQAAQTQQAAAIPPPPRPPPPMSRGQTIAAYGSAIGPAAASILTNLAKMI